MLGIVAIVYSLAKRPETWRPLVGDGPPAGNAAPTAGLPEKVAEAPRPPNGRPGDGSPLAPPELTDESQRDADDEELATARVEFSAISDRTPVTKSEMPAYWRCLTWAGAHDFAELEARARGDVRFSEFWEQPEKHRGRLYRLRLHIKRILQHEVPENKAGVKTLYEAWGWTDESLSYPYVVLFAELPPGMPVGGDIRAEGLFVGYFLKQMSYRAYDAAMAAPLLLGRMKAVAAPTPPPARGPSAIWFVAAIAGLVAIAIARMWFGGWSVRRAGPLPVRTADEDELSDWFQQQKSAGPEGPLDRHQREPE
jgi:hypothetical protein